MEDQNTNLQLAARLLADVKHEKQESVFRKAAPLFTIISALVALSTFFVNTQLRKKQLTFSYLGSDSIVQINRGALNGHLTMQYGNLPIESLYKLRFSLRNSGALAVRRSDVVEPLVVKFPSGYTLLDPAIVEQTRPSFTISIVRDASNPQLLLIDSPLLNAGDEATFSVNALRLGTSAPSLQGRVVDVKQIQNVDLSVTESKGAQRTSPSLLWTLVVLNGLLATLFLVLLIVAFVTFIRGRSWDRKYKPLVQAAVQKAKDRPSPPSGKDDKVLYALLEDRRLNETSIKELGLPRRPGTMADDWRELLAMSATFLLLGTFTGLTCYTLIVNWLS